MSDDEQRLPAGTLEVQAGGIHEHQVEAGEQIAAMRKGSYKVVKVNIDAEPQIAQQYDVQSIPMIGLFRNGRLERAALGAKPRQQIEAELGMLVIP